MKLMKKTLIITICILSALLQIGCGKKDSNIKNTENNSTDITTAPINTPEASVTVGVDEEIKYETVEPDNYQLAIYVTINPELVIYLDETGNIIKMDALNQDAYDICSTLVVENEAFESGLKLVLETANEMGFVSEESTINLRISGNEKVISASERANVLSQADSVLASFSKTGQLPLNLEVYVAKELVFEAGYSGETSTDSNYETIFSEEGIISEETICFKNGNVQEYFYRADGTLQKSILTLVDGWRYECEYYENEIMSKSSTYHTTGATTVMEFNEAGKVISFYDYRADGSFCIEEYDNNGNVLYNEERDAAGNLVSYCEKTYSEDEVPVLLSIKTYSEVDGSISEQYFDASGNTTETNCTFPDGRTSATYYYEDGSGYKAVDNYPDGSIEIHYMDEKGLQKEYYYYDASTGTEYHSVSEIEYDGNGKKVRYIDKSDNGDYYELIYDSKERISVETESYAWGEEKISNYTYGENDNTYVIEYSYNDGRQGVVNYENGVQITDKCIYPGGKYYIINFINGGEDVTTEYYDSKGVLCDGLEAWNQL